MPKTRADSVSKVETIFGLRWVLALLAVAHALQPVLMAGTVEIRGYVLRQEEPVQGAVIRVLAADRRSGLSIEAARARSDGLGHFVVHAPWDREEGAPRGRLLEVSDGDTPPRALDLSKHYFVGPGANAHVGAVHLDRGVRLEGTIDAMPGGEAGPSRLVLWREDVDRPAARVHLTQQTASRTAYALPGVDPGSYFLGIERSDGVVERLGGVVASASSRPRTWRASSVAHATGRVVGSSGTPLVGATVRALAPAPVGAPARWLEPSSVQTDSDGRFVAPYPRHRAWILEVERPGYLTHRRTFARLPARRGYDEVLVRLHSSALIRGIVFDVEDPELTSEVRNARVNVVPLSGATHDPVTVTTDSDGEFVSPLLAPGSYRATISAEGYEASERIVSVPEGATEAPWQRFELEPQGTATLRIEVATCGGSVPLSNARVRVKTDGERYPRDAILDERGRARLPGTPVDRELSAWVIHPWHEPLRLDMGHRIDRDGSTLQIELPEPPWRLAQAAGRVFDAEGAPVAGARIEAFPINQHAGLAYYAVTDPKGRFWVGPMPEGAYWVKTDAVGYAQSVSGLRVKPTAPLHEVTVHKGATITGELLGATPDVGWRVFAHRLGDNETARAWKMALSMRGYPSDSKFGRIVEGAYVVEGVPPGRWVIVAETGEGAEREEYRAELELTTTDRSSGIDLKPHRVPSKDGLLPFVGRVIDAQTGAGLPNVGIRVGGLAYYPRGGLFTPRNRSADSGGFSVPNEIGLPARLLFHLPGYTMGEHLVTEESQVDEIEVVLQPTPGIDYQVEWVDGQTPHLRGLTLLATDGRRLDYVERSPPTPDGYWASAPPGHYILEVEHSFGVVRTPVEIPGPKVVVELLPTGSALLQIPDLEMEMGKGWLDGMAVTATPLGEPTNRDPIVVHERYNLSLAPGLWRLNVKASDGRSWTTDVVIRDREFSTAFFR